ncbi:MAG: sporulation protein [Actinomycetota bacterium]
MAERPEATTLGQILDQARDTMTVRRVFGEAYESEGCLVVPVAAVRGAGGGGGGGDAQGNAGSGGGFGMGARPVGVYRIRGDEVTWMPAVDATRIAMLGGVVAIVALLVLRSVVKRVVGRR